MLFDGGKCGLFPVMGHRGEDLVGRSWSVRFCRVPDSTLRREDRCLFPGRGRRPLGAHCQSEPRGSADVTLTDRGAGRPRANLTTALTVRSRVTTSIHNDQSSM